MKHIVLALALCVSSLSYAQSNRESGGGGTIERSAYTLLCTDTYSADDADVRISADIVDETTLTNFSVWTSAKDNLQGATISIERFELRPVTVVGIEFLNGYVHASKMSTEGPVPAPTPDYNVILTLGTEWYATQVPYTRGQVQFYCDECGGGPDFSPNLYCQKISKTQ